MKNLLLDYAQWGDLHKEQAAEILHKAFAHAPTGWANIDKCERDVGEYADAKSRIGVGFFCGGQMQGWIGAIRQHSCSWELHPLCVHPDHQRKGAGRALVKALEGKAHDEGVSTLWLLTDDDFGGTNLFGMDLYPNVLESLSGIQETNGHPFTFYQKIGFRITGVIPDATGFGRPDILMSKRVCRVK